jgi:2-haloacid dehalogenase
MEEVRSGRRAWTILDVLHRESLDKLLEKQAITGLSEADKDHVTRVWHRLQPWPDTVEGLRRLKTRYIIGTLSNGNVGLLTRMAKHAGLPWDVVLGAETARAYKPLPQAYLASAELLNLAPGQVMLVAAHNSDLAAAASCGLRTAFVARPTEYGPAPEGRLQGRARLGCGRRQLHGCGGSDGVLAVIPGAASRATRDPEQQVVRCRGPGSRIFARAIPG